MKFKDLPVGSYFQFKKEDFIYCKVHNDYFQRIDCVGTISTHCDYDVVRVDIHLTVNRDKEMREAMKKELIKMFDAQRASICRCVHFNTETEALDTKNLTEEQKENLNKCYALFDNYVEFFQSQDF